MNKPLPVRSNRVLWLVLLVCMAPIVSSYIAYYWLRPDSRSNYGELIEPQRPLPGNLQVTSLHGQYPNEQALRGQFWLITLADGQCPPASECDKRLWLLRQLRTALGTDRERFTPVWVVTNQATPNELLFKSLGETSVWRVNDTVLRNWLPTTGAQTAEQYLYLVDPLGNLVMRYPAQADPTKLRKDMVRMLYATRNWVIRKD